MAPFAVSNRSRFGGQRGDIPALIGCGVMRNLMIFAALMVVLGTAMAQMADQMTPASPALANASLRTASTETGLAIKRHQNDSWRRWLIAS